jgi:DNA-binding response OmpR family regulator
MPTATSLIGAAQRADHDPAPGLLGLRFFLVEDERMVSAQLEDMLAEYGCVVEAIATTVAEALSDLKGGAAVDAAILDVDVAGQKVFPVADLLARNGVPILFSTDRILADLPARYPGRPILRKPYVLADLAAALAIISRTTPLH